MKNKYDVIMIGAGPSAIFCAYELMQKRPETKILMIEKGRRIEQRKCPKGTQKSVLDASRVQSPQALPAQERFQTANCLFLLM